MSQSHFAKRNKTTNVDQMRDQTGIDPTLYALHQTHEERNGRQHKVDSPVVRASGASSPRGVEPFGVCTTDEVDVGYCEDEAAQLIAGEAEL